jgi:hypothetical protein
MAVLSRVERAGRDVHKRSSNMAPTDAIALYPRQSCVQHLVVPTDNITVKVVSPLVT